MMAMISYRTANSFEHRFGRSYQNGSGLFQVQSYLDYQGQKLSDRFDAVTYVRLTEAMDSHDVARGRGSYQQVLGNITIPALIMGIDSDLLYPVQEQKELAGLLGNGQLALLHSDFGHDAFLIEFDGMEKIIRTFLNEHVKSQTVQP
jgi:homoserine O-acetyltransferase